MLWLILFIMSELNQYLFAADSLANRTQQIQTAYTWNSQTLSNVFSGRSIQEINWGKATGGTATLGGNGNGNGLLLVNNAAGSEVTRLDNNGLTVTNGSISVKNSAGTTIMDAYGLVSGANFRSSSVEDSSQRDFSNGSFSDISNTSISLPTLDRTTKILVIYNIQAHFYLFGSDTIENAVVTLNIDGTDQTGNIFYQATNGIRMNTGSVFSFDSLEQSIIASGIISLSSGSHTLKLRASASTAASNVFRVTNTSLIYIILGS